MKDFYRLMAFVGLTAFAAGAIVAQTITTAGSGSWSSTTADAPWPGGVIPTAVNNVIIADGSTVTLDQNAAVNDLTVGTGGSGTLQFSKTQKVVLTVNGNMLLQAGSTFKVQSRDAATPEILDTVVVYKNFTNAGALNFDMRTGSSGSTLVVGNFVFAGTGISVVTQGVYNSSGNEFNGIEIRKTGSGKIVLGSDVVMGGGSTSQMTASPILKFNGGLIETGSFKIVTTYGNEAACGTGSATSYVVGALGRGFSNSGGTSRWFPVGDAKGYRPIRVTSTTAGGVTQHMGIVRCIGGDANLANSTYGNGIDQVSHVRYYSLQYSKELSGAGSAPDTMQFWKFYPSYGTDDGVAAGNTNLRAGYAADSLKTWKGLTQVGYPHTTDLSNPPTTIQPDSVVPGITLKSSTKQKMYIALARVAGSKENTLTSGGTGLGRHGADAPSVFTLMQNYPNPFNPLTEIRYGMAKVAHIRLTVLDTQGRTVAVLVDKAMEAGSHRVFWNGRSDAGQAMPSGVYVYRLEAGGVCRTAKMTFLK